MAYRLLDWGMVGGACHEIQIVSCASVKITLNNGINAYIDRFSEVHEYRGFRTGLEEALHNWSGPI